MASEATRARTRKAARPARAAAPAGFRTWDTYVQEATVPDFELRISEDETIRIVALTGDQVLEIEKAMTSDRGMDISTAIRLLCGDEADTVMELVGAAPAGAMNALVGDIMRHFGLDSGEARA